MTESAALPPIDALLIVSFGGPEGRDEVIPFLENVLRGRNVPRERMLQVAEHYYHFGGVSPINRQCRELIAAVEEEFRRCGIGLPVYWGNRNWHPLLPDTVARMAREGIRHAAAFVTSAFGSYSGCRQYLENIDQARAAVGSDAPRITKLRPFFNHPEFVRAWTDRLASVLSERPLGHDARVVFTAHSIPLPMARTSPYVDQLTETARLVAEACGVPSDRWDLVYQSRSGRPQDPWLEPDILDHLRTLHEQGVGRVIVVPVGFLSDHMEVLYDLDVEAQELAGRLGMAFDRVPTVHGHPGLARTVRRLVEEQLYGTPPESVGRLPAAATWCDPACCPPLRRRPATPNRH
ncbi:MAG: ferrochelatase [Planctomycetota bacterium]|nr:MAG: ferrochelatase [Planctomycetota bacterium]